jgi:hypothetical protein
VARYGGMRNMFYNARSFNPRNAPWCNINMWCFG